MIMIFNAEIILKECKFKTSRSSGAGGQHVNKVETRVTLFFDINNSNSLDAEQKTLIKSKLTTKIDKSGLIQINSQKFKSQIKNKIDVELKLIKLLEKALTKTKVRKKTKVPKEAKLKRLNDKKINSTVKKNRSKPKIDE